MLNRALMLIGIILLSLTALAGLIGLLPPPATAAPAAPSACTPITGDVTTNTTWVSGCYHVATSTVAIQPGVMLTIAPDTRVEFDSGASLQVNGQLRAIGTASQSITFTSAAAQTRCAWNSIDIADTPANARIEHAVIEYACTGVRVNDTDQVQILSNTFQYVGDGSPLNGAIGGDTDNSTISGNTIISSSNGIVLNESFGNHIDHNVILTGDGYGIGLLKRTTAGGDNNQIIDNVISRTQRALWLDGGSGNQVLSNTIALNINSALYLSEQSLASVDNNHLFLNGGGSEYRASIVVTGPNSLPAIAHNVISDVNAAAILFDASASNGLSSASVNANALCSLPNFEVQNNSSININAAGDWWSTNTPISGVNHTGPIILTDPIVASITPAANRLPADGAATTVVTIAFRDSAHNTVPAADGFAGPDARQIRLQTNLGSINPNIVVVNDQGIATATLTAAPITGHGVMTATVFCGYPVTATFDVTDTNVAIAKATSATQVMPGSVVTYAITYSNTSSITATRVIITDALPIDLHYVGDTSGLPCPACTPNATGLLTWTIGDLPPSPTRSFVLTANVSPASCGRSFTNTASIGTATLESNYGDNTAAAASINAICADAAITLTADRSSGPPAAPIDYTIVYANNGPNAAQNVIITDQLPANTIYVSDTSGLPLTNAGDVMTWTRPTLAPSTSLTFGLRLNYTGASSNATLINTAAITSSTFDNNPGNNQSQAVYRIAQTVDVVVVKDDDVGPTTPLNRSSGRKAAAYEFIAKTVLAPTAHRDFVYEGDVVTYTIAVVNVGTYTATNVILTETLPLYTDYLGIGWTPINSRTFITSLNSLASGAGRIVYFVVRVHDPIPPGVSNLVNLVCGYSSDQDTNPDDNCHYEDTPVVVRPLRVSKSAPQCLAPGSDFDYTINFANLSNVAFGNVPITDTLPTYTTYTGSTGWSCAADTCTQIVPSLPPNSSGTSILPVRLSSTFPYTTQSIITNTVAISGGYQFVLASTVDGGPNLAVVKNDNIGPLPLNQQSKWQQLERRIVGAARTPAYREFVRPGEWITYTILYVNTGVGPAHNVILTETLPLYTHYVGGGWTPIDGRHYTIALGDLAPGQGGLRRFIVQVDKPFPIGVDRVINRIDIGGREAECDVSDNWSADDTPVRNDGGLAKLFLPVLLNYSSTSIFTPTVAFGHRNYTVQENAGPAAIDVVLNGASTQTVTVDYATSNGTALAGTHYTATAGMLIFKPGQTAKNIKVGIIDNAVFGGSKTVKLSLSNPIKADLGDPNKATLTIKDNEVCITQSHTITSNYSPMGLAYQPSIDRLFIANRDGPQGGNLTAATISPTQITRVVTGLLSAQSVAFNTADHRLYVVGWDWLYVLNSDTYTTVATVTLGTEVNAHAVAYNPNNRKIYVTGFNDNSITIINADTLTILNKIMHDVDHPLKEPSFIAVNTNTQKVYVSNHNKGKPGAWVSVVSGSTDQIINTIYLDPGGDLYGIAADNVHNRIYVASISAARVYAIDGATDTQIGDIQIQSLTGEPVPLRMVAVNPSPYTGSGIRLWLTSSSSDLFGQDTLIAITGNWPAMSQPGGTDLPDSLERGLLFDVTSQYIVIASAASNVVTVIRDDAATAGCLQPLASDAGRFYTIVRDFKKQ